MHARNSLRLLVGVLASATSCGVVPLEGVQSAEPDGLLVQNFPVEHAQRCRLATVLRPAAVKTTKAGSCALAEGQVDQTFN